MISQDMRETLTPKEREELDWEKQLARMQMDYGLQVERLKADVAALDVKWTQVFKVPLAIVLLPVRLILAIAIPISAITGKQLPKDFWSFMQ